MSARAAWRQVSPRALRMAAAVVGLGACMRVCVADEEPGVTPYRPTVSNPADLSTPGWLEGEFGVLRTLGEDHSRNDSAPWLLKYAVDENHGLLIGGNAYVRAMAPGVSTLSGIGDTFVEWKQRFPVGDKAAFGVEAGVLAATARRGLGAGAAQALVNGIFSTDLGAFHLDVNAGAAHGGGQPDGVSRWQTNWAAALSLPLTRDWGGAFELSGTHQAGTATKSQALAALSYNVSRRLALDFGGAYGLSRAAHDRSLFAGATVLIGQLR